MRYQVGKAIEQERVGRIVNVVKEMEDSMTVNVVYHSDDSNTGLALTKMKIIPASACIKLSMFGHCS